MNTLREEIIKAVHGPVSELIAKADQFRRKYKSNQAFTCGIINAKSGQCSQDCSFCAQSGHYDTKISVYPFMDTKEIIEHALRLDKAGVTNFSIVTSGLMLTPKEMNMVVKAVDTIKVKTGCSVCASLGNLTQDMAISLKQCGLTNYHHNLETAESFFDQVCTTHAYEDDLKTIKLVQEAGLKICSGGIMGLGETWEQRIELALCLQNLNVDCIPLNFLHPVPGTPLANQSLLAPLEAVKSIALYRLINPEKDIVICGGREVSLKEYQSWVFLAGANGLMVGNYLTTKGRDIQTDLEMIKEMGLVL